MTTPYTTFQPVPYDTDLCSLGKCPIEYAMLSYLPTVTGNSVYIALFGILLALQTFLGLRYRTWGVLIGTTCCFLLEIIGYIGRIIMHSNPFPLGNFLLYFIPLSIAPAFLTGGVYTIFGRYIIATSASASRLKPRTYTIFFISCDILSLALQGAGGGLTATSVTEADGNTGRSILIAGLIFQVASMALFLACWADFAFRLHKRVPASERNPALASIRHGWLWTGFQPAVFLSMVFVFVRCIFRAVELNQGFNGSLANDEVTFMVLEGPMILIAGALLTVWHPGFVFRGLWKRAVWKFNGREGVECGGQGGEKGLASPSDSGV